MLTRAQAVAELERIYEILPQIASALADERKPVAQYAKTSYFKDVYGQSMGTVKNRKYGIMNQIKLGRYPKDAIDRPIYLTKLCTQTTTDSSEHWKVQQESMFLSMIQSNR